MQLTLTFIFYVASCNTVKSVLLCAMTAFLSKGKKKSS